jgi:hypothetical protein
MRNFKLELWQNESHENSKKLKIVKAWHKEYTNFLSSRADVLVFEILAETFLISVMIKGPRFPDFFEPAQCM